MLSGYILIYCNYLKKKQKLDIEFLLVFFSGSNITTRHDNLGLIAYQIKL